MKSRIYAMTLAASLTALSAAPLWAQANPEDEPLSDENVPAATSPTPVTPNGSTSSNATSDSGDTSSMTPENQELSDADLAPDASSTGTPSNTTVVPSGETVTIPRAVWEQLQRDVAELKASRGAATTVGTSGETTTAPAIESESTEAPAPPRTYLTLPDISFNAQAKGRYSSDKRDEDRRKLSLAEAELAIQSYVYPNVRAEAFIVAEPGEDVPFGLEQGFLDFLGVRKGLTIRVGRDFTPFGRTGRQHTHSWLYTRQLIPIRNIVASEELGGDGVSFSYTFPSKKGLYVNATLGAYNGLSGGGVSSSNPFGQDLPVGTGAGYDDRFYLGRLVMAHPLGSDGELELGSSYARGRSTLNDDTGFNLGKGNVDLLGFDVSYRKFFDGDRRLLLRSEYFRNKPSGGLPTSTASGYYGLANMRLNKFVDVGLLYENSGFPQAPGQRESALSLIYTKRLTEQFYIRLQGTSGRRPGQGRYNEATLQFTWGVGPHTHALE